VNMGVILDIHVYGSWTQPVDTAREHGPWTRVVCTELYTPEFDCQDNDVTREN